MRRASRRGSARPRPLLALLVVLAALAGAAGAQEGHPAPGGPAAGPPDVPEGPARVEGRLVHATRPEAAAGVEVLLYALGSDGSAGLRSTTSDAQGRFVFEGVSNDPDVVYLLGARQGEVPFGRRFGFEAGELEHAVELELSDPLSDAALARLGAVDVRFDRGCTHLRVRHVHAVENPGEQVLFVPPERRGELPPLLEVAIPADAEGFESLLAREGLTQEDGRVRFWGPLYPGSQDIQFGYGLPLESGTLRLGFPDGASTLRVLAPESVLAVSSASLEPGATETVEGQRYAGLRGAVAPGGSVALDVTPLQTPDSPLLLPRAEIWAELDDAALEVNESLEVAADDPLPASPGRPWMCLPLPAEAASLRFSPDTLRAGLRRDPSGALAVHGPLPAGESQLAVSYRLPAGPEGATLRRSFDRELALFHVLVADTGVVAETERMHRRRTVRSGDRLFQHYEAFAVSPDEVVELDLRRTPPRGGGSRWAATAGVAVAALAALVFLSAPLRASRPAERPPDQDDPRAVEREAIRRSLADLDEDLETGKLSAEDHAALRAELRGRAANLLMAEREAKQQTRAPAAAAEVGACAACGAAPRPEDRFCSQCGAALGGGPSPS